MARDVDIATPGHQPWEGGLELCWHIGVLDTADTDLAQLIPACPGEVTKYVGIVLHQLPVGGNMWRERFSADDDTTRKEFAILLLAPITVVYASNIQHRERLASHWLLHFEDAVAIGIMVLLILHIPFRPQ